MLSDEEKKAINQLKADTSFYDYELKNGNYIYELFKIEVYKKDIDVILNLIEKQSKEIEHQKEKRANQKKELAILNAKQIEFNKLVNTVNSYKGQFKRQEKEIEELKKYKEGYKLLSYSLDNYTSKDKIKAKIEELEKQDRESKMSHNYLVIPVLQSLLEKE